MRRAVLIHVAAVALWGEQLLAQGAPAPVGKSVHEAAGAKLIDLIEHHPMAELRYEMQRLIAMDCLWVYTVGDADYFLTVMHRIAGVCHEDHGCCDELCPVLRVSTKFLLRLDRPDEWRMLVLWHEYLHIRSVALGLTQPLPCDEPPGSQTEEEVTAFLEEELRAYDGEYALAAALGFPVFELFDHEYREHGRAAMACSVEEDYEALPFYRDHIPSLRRAVAAYLDASKPLGAPRP